MPMRKHPAPLCTYMRPQQMSEFLKHMIKIWNVSMV